MIRGDQYEENLTVAEILEEIDESGFIELCINDSKYLKAPEVTASIGLKVARKQEMEMLNKLLEEDKTAKSLVTLQQVYFLLKLAGQKGHDAGKEILKELFGDCS